MATTVNYKIFLTPEELANGFAEELIGLIKVAEKRKTSLTIAISGGSTPRLLFSVLSEKYSSAVDWSVVKLLWVDERCVPPDDVESNFGMTNKILLSKIEIPSENVFRIRGEDDPEKEAERYSVVIDNQIRQINSIPVFDIVLLGMGEDGHTASIFPGNEKLFSSKKNCDVAVHPVSGQNRITLTGKVINNARSVFFLVTGISKADIVNEIFRNSAVSGMFPAAHVRSLNGKTTWLLDNEAGKFIA
jgi:6-phosphogluconolactonase